MEVLNLDARIGLDTSDYNQGLDNAEKKFLGFGSNLASGIGKAVSSVVNSIKTIAGAVGDATSKFMKDAVASGMTFDSSMSQVAATMGKTVDQIGELREFAQKMGSETAFSASQAADALNYMALAGYDASTSMDMLPTVLDLAAAGGIELATASDMVTDASSALGLSIDETKVMIDQMAVASSKTNTSVAQLGDAILTVGGTAKGLKGGTQELTQVLGLMADNGIKASEAGTHLRNIMLAMNPSTDDAIAAFERLGLETYDNEGKLRSMSDIFADLSSKMSDMSDQEKTEILTNMFNKTDLSAVNALLATSAERWQEVSDAIGDYEGAASQMADTQLDNMAGDITLLQSAWEGLQIVVSDKVVPAIRPFIQLLAQLASGITNTIKNGGSASDVFDRIYHGLDGVRIRLVQMIKKALPDIIEAVTGIAENIKDKISKLAPRIAKAIPDIINHLIESFKSKADLILEVAPVIFEGITNGISENLPKLSKIAFALIKAISEFIIDSTPMLVESAIGLIKEFSNFIAENAPLMVSKITLLIAELAKMLTSPDSIGEMVDVAITLITTLVECLVDVIPILLEAAPIIIENLSLAIQENVPKLLECGWKIIETLLNALLASLPDFLKSGKQIIDSIGTGMMSVLMSIVNIFKKMHENAKAKNREALEEYKSMGLSIAKKFIEGVEWAKEGIVNLIESAKTWGKDMIDNFIGGIKEKAGALADGVAEAAQTIKDFFGFSEPKKGPLSNFHTYAPDMIDLFNEGLKKSEGKLKMQLTDTTELIGEGFAVSGNNTGYTAGGTVINITVTSGTISSDYDSRRAAAKISESLATLRRAESAAVGKAV